MNHHVCHGNAGTKVWRSRSGRGKWAEWSSPTCLVCGRPYAATARAVDGPGDVVDLRTTRDERIEYFKPRDEP